MESYWEHFKTPFICFAGFSGVGKTTLIERLIQRFNEDDFSVGYYKHDSHRFTMDREGKDTERCARAGAGIVAINDPRHFGLVADDSFKKRTVAHALEQCDCILIEGYKKSPFNKIVFLDAEGKLPIPENSKGIKAVIHQGEFAKAASLLDDGVPKFHRDEVDAIYQFVRSHFTNCISPLYGAVFVGGKSRRMGSPKFQLSYNGQSETERMVAVLKTFCENVVLSSRADLDMGALGDLPGVERVNDDHAGLGPVGGLATLMGRFPNKAWLITACDTPFLSENSFQNIVDQRDPLRYGTCYTQKGKLGYEPMCAIYEPKFIRPLFDAMSIRELSLSRIISDLPFKLAGVREEDRQNFMNVNTPEEYKIARAKRERENQPQ